jgi:ectoine hydroxylase-related dioxygenase (phytanoyl-CoA dioxygenase family)
MRWRKRAPEHRSRFGGLWTDRLDAPVLVEEGLAAGQFSAEDGAALRHWLDHGYAVLRHAVPEALCDAVRSDLERCRSTTGAAILCQSPDGATFEFNADAPPDDIRVLDAYVHFVSAREALFSAPIVHFLELVFQDRALLFQSLSFERGSNQGMHQDTFFVVVDRPMELAAAWIALEHVQAGSGELMYYDGSHRTPEFTFSGAHKHWNRDRDGTDQLDAATRHLHASAVELGFRNETFLPRKGDVFIWSADLVHGGTPRTDSDLTRASLVGHYCPADAKPNYFSHTPARAVTEAFGEDAYASYWYDVRLGVDRRDRSDIA